MKSNLLTCTEVCHCMETSHISDKTLCVEKTQQECSHIPDTSTNVWWVLTIIYGPVTWSRNDQGWTWCFYSAYTQCITVVQPDIYAYFKHPSHQELILFVSSPENVKTDIRNLFMLYFDIGLFMSFSHLLTSFNINLSISSSVYLSS
jgi:hypothetical protein